eukprot:452778_1
MSKTLPTKCEVGCAGISMVTSQILLIAASSLYGASYDKFDVNNEQDAIELHKILSNSPMLYQGSCILIWICFPLTIISAYGISRVLGFIVQGTWGELVVYLMEKAYILLALLWVIIPSILLTIVSYDWSFQESEISTGIAPGYYVQLGFTLFQLQLSDNVLLIEGTFLVPVFIVIRYIVWKAFNAENVAYQQLYNMMRSKIIAGIPCCTSSLMFFCRECMIIGTALTIFIICLLILCEFAQSGLFAPESMMKYIAFILFIVKIFLGWKLIWLSRGNRLQRIEDMFNREHGMMEDQGMSQNIDINIGGNVQLQKNETGGTPYTPLQDTKSRNASGFPDIQ